VTAAGGLPIKVGNDPLRRARRRDSRHEGSRVYENTGIPLHADNQTIIREHIYLDKTDPNMLPDEITTIDHALTNPLTVVKDYRRTPTRKPLWWSENVRAENNVHVTMAMKSIF
jgi:hypothetical protein